MSYATAIAASVQYLSSPAAEAELAVDAYWPKWHSPWWHMLLLHEMGEGQRIPDSILPHFIERLNKIPLKIFPIHPEDLPPGVDPHRGTPCHCQLGCVYQVLAARGVDVDRELPWIRPWFLRYQMADGGLNCDNDAYLVQGEVPSSMVGTIGAFEAVLQYTRRPWTTEELAFLERGAAFLIDRQLHLGSPTQHNAAERRSAEAWVELCFPRFYFYDVLRGLSALLLWAETFDRELPAAATSAVVAMLQTRFSDGIVSPGRLAYAGSGTIRRGPTGEWLRRQPATPFPLLDEVSAVGVASPFLSRQWQEARRRMARLPQG